MTAPTRAEAIATLASGQQQLTALFSQLDDTALERPGMVGGGWSAQDLMGHLAVGGCITRTSVLYCKGAGRFGWP